MEGTFHSWDAFIKTLRQSNHTTTPCHSNTRRDSRIKCSQGNKSLSFWQGQAQVWHSESPQPGQLGGNPHVSGEGCWMLWELDASCCGIHILLPQSLPSDVFAHLSCPGPKFPARPEELWTAALEVRPGSSSPPLGALHHKERVLFP